MTAVEIRQGQITLHRPGGAGHSYARFDQTLTGPGEVAAEIDQVHTFM